MTLPAIIAGGGLAGAATACLLASAGRPVKLFERDHQPVEKVCGEFISAEAQAYLARIGLDLASLGAHRIDRLRLIRRNTIVACALPFAAVGLSRRVLDEALLQHAAKCGAEIIRGVSVRLRQAGTEKILDATNGEQIHADTLFVATGKHDLRGLRRRAPAPDLVGFKIHLKLTASQQGELAGHIEIILLADGYAGLQLVENGQANLCLLVDRTRLQKAGGTWPALLEDLTRAEPHLQTRLAGATALHRPLAIFRVPYGFIHTPNAEDGQNIFRLGDQMGVIPSFTGDGMSIALHSAMAAAANHLNGVSAARYHHQMRGDITGQIGRAGALYRLGRTAPGQAILMRTAALWPGGMRLAARLTRVPPQAVARSLMQAGG